MGAPGQPYAGVAQAGLLQAQPQPLDVTIVGVEAGVARLTAGVGAAVVPLALVTAGAGDTWAAEAVACGFVTPHVLGALEVTVALCAAYPDVSKVPIWADLLLRSRTRPSREAFSALALSCELVAVDAVGTTGVALAGPAAPATRHVPMPSCTLVTVGAHHVGQAGAAPRLIIAGHILPCSQHVAGASAAAQGVGMGQLGEAWLAEVASLSLHVFLADTVPRQRVADGAWHRAVRVTLTGLAGFRMGEILPLVAEIVGFAALAVVPLCVVLAVIADTPTHPTTGVENLRVEVAGG